MRLVKFIANFFNSRQYLLYLLLFVIAAGLFGYLQFDRTFADPDSFYHAKMAMLLTQGEVPTEFPWLSATVLKYNFVDHHFLYHVILIPFVTLPPPLFGLKLATVILASLVILIIFWFLRRMKVKGAFWYSFFLLMVNPFIFRLNLAKAPALALILLFLVAYCLLKRYYLCLIILSAIYVWAYGGWPLVLVLVVIFGAASLIWPLHNRGWLTVKKGWLRIYWQNVLLFIAAGIGLAAGLCFNPYFPKNFEFYWQQSFKIAVLNYQHLIGVGGEWYPYQPVDLLAAAAPFFILFVFALAGFVITARKQPLVSWFFLLLSFLFFALTIKSRRYVEYFIPLAVCFSALTINVFWDSVRDFLTKIIPKRFSLLIPLVILLAFSPFFIRDLRLIKNSYRQGFPFDKFAEPARWLAENSQAGDIVFHSDWDEFPFLFYNNSKNYYLVGLDPTFMYKYDQDLYQRWVDITTGKLDENLYQTIKEDFRAEYVFVDLSQSQAFDRNLANNFYFQEVFENEEAKIYKVTE